MTTMTGIDFTFVITISVNGIRLEWAFNFFSFYLTDHL